jgi:CheY-like chemotaxis protein
MDGTHEPVRYVIDCASCSHRFDALRAEWCSCLASERTLVCPACRKCFCNAPRPWKQRFWSDAPKEMWDAKLEVHRARPPRVNPPSNQAGRPLLLVVDDEPVIREAAARVAEREGFHVIVAEDGPEGIVTAKNYRPDVVLTDALMPRMDGREMCRRLKDDPRTGHAKIVVMTSLYKGQRYKSEALAEFGADAYLHKPLDAEVLAKTLRELKR